MSDKSNEEESSKASIQLQWMIIYISCFYLISSQLTYLHFLNPRNRIT